MKYYWNANISLGKIRNISYIPSPPSTLSVFLRLCLIYSTNIESPGRRERNLDKCDGYIIKCTDRYSALHGGTRKSKDWHAFLLFPEYMRILTCHTERRTIREREGEPLSLSTSLICTPFLQTPQGALPCVNLLKLYSCVSTPSSVHPCSCSPRVWGQINVNIYKSGCHCSDPPPPPQGSDCNT